MSTQLKRQFKTRKTSSFTLVEILVSMAVFSIILLILMAIIGQISSSCALAVGKAGQFNEARTGFESMTRRLSQATLNSYMSYVVTNGMNITYVTPNTAATFVPNSYARASELRFISGPNLAENLSSSPARPTDAVFFQAPLGFVADTTDYGGLSNLLNTWGYYIEFNSDQSEAPSFVTSFLNNQPRYRFRLIEMMEPSENLSLYKYTAGNVGLTTSQPNGSNWYTDPLNAGSYAHVLAENIVALIIFPQLSPQDQATATSAGATGGTGMLAPDYSYDSTSSGEAQSAPNATVAGIVNSRNQLPPLVNVTMVAVDESSFKRFQGNSTSAPDLGLSGLFQSVGDVSNPSNPGYARDLQTLRTTLSANHLKYQVFNTVIAIKSAKWSSAETN